MATRSFGERILRNEDERLLRGRGMYLDDIAMPGVLHAAFVRSTYAHAEVTRVEIEEARAHAAVVAVYTCDDIGHVDRELPLLIPHPFMQHPQTQRPLARGHVDHVGQPIAMVVAESRYAAEDACELVEVDYEPLPVVVDLAAAAEPDAPR